MEYENKIKFIKYLSSLFLFIFVFLIQQNEVYAYTYKNEKKESINYTIMYKDGRTRPGRNGDSVYMLGAGGFSDNVWMISLAASINGDYSGNIEYKQHVNYYGWKNKASNGAWTDVIYQDIGIPVWIEAVSMKLSGEVSNYYYLSYDCFTSPASWNYILNEWGEHRADGEAHTKYCDGQNEGVWNRWVNGLECNGNPNYSGSDDAAKYELGNWAGTYGYWLATSGFRASIYKFPCTVSIDANGGSFETNSVTGAADGTLIFDNVPTKAGSVFNGWEFNYEFYGDYDSSVRNQKPANNIAPSIRVSGSQTTISMGNAKKITLKAKWRANSPYAVGFNANGGLGTMNRQLFVNGQSAQIQKNTFTRPGYTFKGWSTTPNGAVQYADKQTVTNIYNAGKTVYGSVDYIAVYNYEYYKNAYADLNGSEEVLLEHFVNYGMAEGRRASPEFDVNYYRSHYGDLTNAWSDKRQYYLHYINNGQAEGRRGSDTGASMILYAQWQKNYHSVTLQKTEGIESVKQDGYTNLYDFINTGYQSFLHRGVDNTGYNSYGNLLINHSLSENEAAAFALDLTRSTEFMSGFNKNGTTYTNYPTAGTQKNPYQLVADCYRFFLNRNGSKDEITGWVRNAYAPNSRNTELAISAVVKGIGNSAEAMEKLSSRWAFNKNSKKVMYVSTDKAVYTRCVNYGENVMIDAKVLNGYTWHGWTGSYNISDKKYSFIMPDEDIILTANASINVYTIGYNLDGGTVTPENPTSYTLKTEDFTLKNPTKTGFSFMGWTGSNGDIPQLFVTIKKGTLGNLNFKANWKRNQYKIVLNKATGVEEVSGAGTYYYEEEVTIDAVMQEGYHWKGWSGTFQNEEKEYTFKMPACDVELMANGMINTYTLHFEPNDGKIQSPIDDITLTYDVEVMLPDAEGNFVKYTLDGENITAEMEAVPEKRAYASVFMGWSLETAREDFEPQWKAENVRVKDIVNAAGMEETDGAEITLYAIWDDCPWIVAQHLYYTLEQAQSGYITEEEILSHQTASDREDGSPIAAGVHENGTAFTIPDYSQVEFTQFIHDGSCTENLTVKDSAGNIYEKQIIVYVTDTTEKIIRPEGTTRFISEKYYYMPYEEGGLSDTSVWRTEPEYRHQLQKAFENLRNKTPVASYEIPYETRIKIRDYVSTYGFGNSKEPQALKKAYELFFHNY